MAYIHEETIAGETLIVRNHYSNRWKKRNLRREPPTDKTERSQIESHNRRDIWELTIRLNENFYPGDYYMTFTYRPEERPQTIEQAKKDRKDLLRKLRRLYKKNETELKFIASTEFGKKGALHHHFAMNGDVDVREIYKLWDKGFIDLKPLTKDREYSKIASYFIKGRKQWKEAGGKGRMWTCSKNLVRPETKKWIVKANSFLKNPRNKKGFIVLKETLHEGINQDGFPYQNYIMLRSRGDPP